MEFRIDYDKLEKLLEEKPKEISEMIMEVLKEEAKKLVDYLMFYSPYDKDSKEKHMSELWRAKKILNGYLVVNNKYIKNKKNDGLAYLLNNYDKTKHYKWFDNLWQGYESGLNERVTTKINEIIKENFKNG